MEMPKRNSANPPEPDELSTNLPLPDVLERYERVPRFVPDMVIRNTWHIVRSGRFAASGRICRHQCFFKAVSRAVCSPRGWLCLLLFWRTAERLTLMPTRTVKEQRARGSPPSCRLVTWAPSGGRRPGYPTARRPAAAHRARCLQPYYRIPIVSEMWRNGIFFSRWAPDLVYGQLPLFNFYPP